MAKKDSKADSKADAPSKETLNLVNKINEAIKGTTADFDKLVSNAYALGKALGMSKVETDKIRGDYFAINSLTEKMDAKIMKLAKTEQQMDFYLDHQQNI